jgi:hypothetical protein
MKKLILITLAIFAFVGTSVSQTSCCSKDSTENGVDFYVSAGLSISNTFDTTFSYSSYPSVEFGFMKDNFSLGLVAGRGNLSGFNNDDISNYWYEVKTAVSVPVGKFSGYALLGIGNYITTSRVFVEYGAGFSYSFNKFGVFSQFSNWDGTWYVTPGISYTF